MLYPLRLLSATPDSFGARRDPSQSPAWRHFLLGHDAWRRVPGAPNPALIVGTAQTSAFARWFIFLWPMVACAILLVTPITRPALQAKT